MKRIFALFLCLIIIACTAVPVFARYHSSKGDGYVLGETYTLGDANGDGEQNGKDALAIKATVAGIDGYDVIRDAADFNGDGVVDAKDSFLMKTCMAGTNTFESLEGEYQLYNLTIAGNPISEYSILLPEDTDVKNSNAYYAAEEMQEYVEKVTGVHLDICIGTAPTELVIRYHSYVPDTEENLEMGLGIENYRYMVENGDLNIHGSLRGNMYATYDILEKYLGIRFIDGDLTYIYKSRTSDIPEGVNEYYVPKVNFRNVNHTFTDGYGDKLNLYFPQKNNGIFIWDFMDERHGTLTGIHYCGCHTFLYCYQMASGTMPDESFGTLAERLNYKMSTGYVQDWSTWQPCGTSQSEYEFLFDGLVDITRMMETWGHVIRTYEREYTTSSMSFSPEDNLHYCTCRNCRKIAITQKEGYSGLYVEMANKAAIDIQEYYPGLKMSTYLYLHDVPATIRPNDLLIIFFCGPHCNNHALGTGGCGDELTVLENSNKCCDNTAKGWGDICRETGAEMWLYYYPVTYGFFLAGCPNILEIYYDLTYLINECGFNGVFYEGGGEEYLFEHLKAYLTSRVICDPDMSFEAYVEYMKEYLYIWYGDGWEYIYEYILYTEAAGDATGCFIVNHDAPWDMYSYVYIKDHYMEMRELLLSALALAETETQEMRINNLIMSCDTLGLSAVHSDWYTNGTEESRARYERMYTDLYYYIKNNNINISGHVIYELPNTVVFDRNPTQQFYNGGAWDVNDQPK